MKKKRKLIWREYCEEESIHHRINFIYALFYRVWGYGRTEVRHIHAGAIGCSCCDGGTCYRGDHTGTVAEFDGRGAVFLCDGG
jgi:hypothetical protein